MSIQFAVNVLFPVDPFVIVTVVCGVAPFEPVHPLNIYPCLDPDWIVISESSIVYECGFWSEFSHPFKLYVIE